MDPTETKSRSKTWIWIVVILLLILTCCCCAALGGGLLYLRSEGQTLQDALSDGLEIPPNNLEEILGTPIPDEPQELPLQEVPTPQPEADAQSAADAGSLLVMTDRGIWAVDEGTNAAVQLSSEPLDAPWPSRDGLSPDGQVYAYITGMGGASINPMLVVLDLRQQVEILRLELTGPLSQPNPESSVCDPDFEAVRALDFTGNLAWSPDSQQLAFASARDGSSADLVVFDRRDASFTRLTSEEGNVSGLHWSGDGQWIEYETINCFGTGAGLIMDGLWVYDLSGGQPRLLESLESSGEQFLGWVDDSTFLISSWDPGCSYIHLRSVNLLNNDQKQLFDGCFSSVDFNSEMKDGMLTVTSFDQDFCTCATPREPGLYTFGPDTSSDWREVVGAYTVEFIPAGRLFVVYGGDGLQNVYDESGMELSVLPELKGKKPLPSPDGTYWAWASYYGVNTGLWVTQNNANPVEISPLFSGKPIWSGDGQALYYIENNRLYQAAAPDFQPELVLDAAGAEMLGLVN